MYELYEMNCKDQGIKPVCTSVYSGIFNKEFNFSFKPPDKDTCKTCDLLSTQNKRAMMALNRSPDQFPHKMNSTLSITIAPTYDPRDGASFDPRGII